MAKFDFTKLTFAQEIWGNDAEQMKKAAEMYPLGLSELADLDKLPSEVGDAEKKQEESRAAGQDVKPTGTDRMVKQEATSLDARAGAEQDQSLMPAS